MNSDTTETNFTDYAVFFANEVQKKINIDGIIVWEGVTLTDFCKVWNTDAAHFKEEFDCFIEKLSFLKIANELSRIEVNIEIVRFYFLCKFIKDIATEHYFCLLKPQIKDTLKEFDNIDSITFTNKNDSHTSGNSKLIDIIKNTIANHIDDDSTHYEVEKWVKIGDISNKIAVNSKFVYYMATFLSSYFPNAKRRANCGLVDRVEQDLIRHTLYALDMTPAVITLSRYRQLIQYYNKIQTTASHSIVDGKLFPITFIKYADWHNKTIDWTTPNAKIAPLKVGETVSF